MLSDSRNNFFLLLLRSPSVPHTTINREDQENEKIIIYPSFMHIGVSSLCTTR